MQKTINIFLATLPATLAISFICLSVYWCCIRESLATNRIRKLINQESIAGNKIAIAMKTSYLFRMDWEDEDLITEALKGNEHAIRALKIDIEERKK